MSGSNASRKASLKKAALVADLAENELEFLASVALARHYKAGEMIFSEGDPCEGLYVIESGAVKIFKTSPSGREQVLTLEGPGASIAELPVFDGGNYPASAAPSRRANYCSFARRTFARCAWNIPKWRSKFCGWSARGCGDW